MDIYTNSVVKNFFQPERFPKTPTSVAQSVPFTLLLKGDQQK